MLERPTVISGGFPCQDISSAGRRAGITGKRSGLWKQMVRAIRLVRPKFAVVENVAALRVRGMGTVLGDLAEIGYDAEWDSLPATFIGAPHERERVFIVAYSDRTWESQSKRSILDERGRSFNSSKEVGNTASEGLPDWAGGPMGQPSPLTELERPGGREIERDFRGVAHGVSNRVDRLRTLGNAVVPQIAEFIAWRIRESMTPPSAGRESET